MIPTHNRAELVAQTLESLAAIRIPAGVKADLVVVANACSDDTVQVCQAALREYPFPARCVEEPQVGLSVARNRAMFETKGEICASLDDDIALSEEWLEGALEVFEKYPADIVAGKIELWWAAVDPPPWFDESHSSLLSGLDYGDEIVEIFPPRCATGGNCAFRREVFEKTGAYRVDLGRIGIGMAAGEDTDFFVRALKNGARMFYAPRMLMKHWVAPQRATVEYLVKVARGNSMSRIRLKQPYGLRQFCRSFVGHGYLTVRYEAERWLAKLRSDAPYEVLCLLRRETGRAGMSAAVNHWLSMRRRKEARSKS